MDLYFSQRFLPSKQGLSDSMIIFNNNKKYIFVFIIVCIMLGSLLKVLPACVQINALKYFWLDYFLSLPFSIFLRRRCWYDVVNIRKNRQFIFVTNII